MRHVVLVPEFPDGIEDEDENEEEDEKKTDVRSEYPEALKANLRAPR
jgi:hypothetical protein